MLSALLCGCAAQAPSEEDETPPAWNDLREITVRSSMDGTEQPSLLWAPQAAESEDTPVFIFLHSWTQDFEQDNSNWLQVASAQRWIFVHPNFRGPNVGPEACGSELAQQDILDVLAYTIEHFEVDMARIYLAGVSGGGHMALLMAGTHPEYFSAVSAWAAISDLAAWFEFQLAAGDLDRAINIVEACGGVPGSSPEADAELARRSSVFHLGNARELPVDINAGLNDYRVPVSQSIAAFNALARAQSLPELAEGETSPWVGSDGSIAGPEHGAFWDEDYQRDIVLRSQAGQARLTVFVGGHGGLPQPAAVWLAAQRRETRHPAVEQTPAPDGGRRADQ